MLVLYTAIVTNTPAQTSTTIPPVILDENYTEWETAEDIANSSGTSNTTIKALNTNDFLFLYFEVQEQLGLQGEERIMLYLDTDNNDQTGEAVNGIGAEVVFNFGTRSGMVYLNGNEYEIGPRALFMVIAPTVWSDQFEISMDRNTQFSGQALFTSETIKVLLKNKATNTFSPAASGGASYTFHNYSFQDLPSYAISKSHDSLVRVMSHNVLFDNLFEPEHQPSFRRMYQTIKPDIIGFQEIYDHSAETTENLIEQMLPSKRGETWHSANIGDNILVSRYFIKEVQHVNNTNNGAFLLDLRPEKNTNLLVINAHMPCCDNHADRQDEIDAIMAFIRDAKQGKEKINIAEKTPILIIGDMNVVGDPHNITTLLTGDIVDEISWGSDFAPDWNDAPFVDAKPRTSSLPMTFTHWSKSGAGNYSSGRLDMMVYSSSVLELKNKYVMYTNGLPGDTLNNYPIQQNDSENASDHLPLVGDFAILTEQDEITLSNLRHNNTEGIPTFIDQTITVSGVITANEVFGEQLAYLQDEHAGISLYGSEFSSQLTKGDSVSLTAKVSQFNGLTQLAYNSESSQIAIHHNTNLPESQTVSISAIKDQTWDNYEILEGKLVTLKGIRFVESGTFSGNTNYSITNGKDTLNLRVYAHTNIVDQKIPDKKVTITGVVGQYDHTIPYDEGYQILPRDTNDITDFDPLQGILRLRQNDEFGKPILMDSIVTVSGVVTLSDKFGSSGPGYMQDSTAGVAIFDEGLLSQIKMGDSVTISTPLGFYKGLTELVYKEGVTEITVHRPVELPQPKTVTLADIVNQKWDGVEELEGMLVKIKNVEITESGAFSTGNYTITDGTHSLQLRIEYNTNIPNNTIPSGKIDITGILGQYDNHPPFKDRYQLLPRNISDFNVNNTNSSLNIKKPSTGQKTRSGDTLHITWDNNAVDRVNLTWKSWQDKNWKTIASLIEASKAEHFWHIPKHANDSCLIKITDSSNKNLYALSGKFHILNEEETVSINQRGVKTATCISIYPNPVTSRAIVELSLTKNEHVTCDLYDQPGKRIRRYDFPERRKGFNRLVLKTESIAPGVYFIQVKNNHQLLCTKAIIKK